MLCGYTLIVQIPCAAFEKRKSISSFSLPPARQPIVDADSCLSNESKLVFSPTGEVLPKVPYRSGGRQEFVFIFEQTRVSIDYRADGQAAGKSAH